MSCSTKKPKTRPPSLAARVAIAVAKSLIRQKFVEGWEVQNLAPWFVDDIRRALTRKETP